MSYSGLYGKGMHDFVLMEAELGTRVAHAQAYEDTDPLGWLDDIHYAEDMARGRRFRRHFMWGVLVRRPQDLIVINGI